MNRKLLVFGIVFLVFLIFFALKTFKPVIADVATDNVTIDVNVTESASIIVVPDTLNWTSVATGTMGGIKQLTIKNAGSLNVSYIYAYVDTLTSENARPYGTGNPKAFSAGSVLVLKNETDTTYYFAGRLEWNWTQDIPTHSWANVVSPVAWGYFRNTSYDYVWLVGNGTPPASEPTGIYCNDSGTEFAIEPQVDLGTQATRTPEDASITRNGGNANWSYFSINQDPLTGSCAAVWWDCKKVFIYHYDRRSTAPNVFSTCVNSRHLQVANLTSGNTILLSVDAWVPNGVPSGYLNTTILTVYATSS